MQVWHCGLRACLLLSGEPRASCLVPSASCLVPRASCSLLGWSFTAVSVVDCQFGCTDALLHLCLSTVLLLLASSR